MTINIDIARLNINLHGISAQIIEDAMQGLDMELRRRIGVRQLGSGLLAATSAVDISELALSPLHMTGTVNAAGLRAMIAERLLDALESRQQSGQTSAGGDL